MRLYTVHLPPGSARAAESAAEPGERLAAADVVLVREGFNWLAFFFSVFWALANGLWLVALAMAAGIVVLAALPTLAGVDWSIQAILLLGYAVYCGASGNDLRRQGLAARGYALRDVVAAPDRAAALLRYGERSFVQPPDPARRSDQAPPPELDLGPSPGFWS
jgi:hypothetical protein